MDFAAMLSQVEDVRTQLNLDTRQQSEANSLFRAIKERIGNREPILVTDAALILTTWAIKRIDESPHK